MGQPQHRCSTCSSAKPPLQFSWSFLMSYIWRSSLPMSQASCGEKSTCWMLNRTFLLSGMKGCYLSRAKRELRAMNIWLLLSALVYLRRCLSTSTREQGSSKTHIFYAVEIDGDSNTASFLAKQHGMQFISKPVRLVHDVYESSFQQSEALSQIHLKGEVGEYQTAHYRDMHAAFPK
ncbi:uncharacterized protein LOC135296419 isoform X2 [Passer domesticus]|uniref:uncharacterized protein LOC135296419 isoform X2 n=1 Tax=Passer domesticus TaxID=48849 RepID=UPI0030FF0DD8